MQSNHLIFSQYWFFTSNAIFKSRSEVVFVKDFFNNKGQQAPHDNSVSINHKVWIPLERMFLAAFLLG